jgi:hypothetical protein
MSSCIGVFDMVEKGTITGLYQVCTFLGFVALTFLAINFFSGMVEFYIAGFVMSTVVWVGLLCTTLMALNFLNQTDIEEFA